MRSYRGNLGNDLVLDKSQATDSKPGKFLLRPPDAEESPNRKRLGQMREKQRPARSHGFLSGVGFWFRAFGWVLVVLSSLFGRRTAEEKAESTPTLHPRISSASHHHPRQRVDVSSGIWRPPQSSPLPPTSLPLDVPPPLFFFLKTTGSKVPSPLVTWCGGGSPHIFIYM